MKRISYVFLFLIVISSLFFSFYNLAKLAPFGWDQARDAGVMWQILREGKPTLIGPGVVGPDSFFLGPLWYYLMLPFFFITGLNPIGAPIFGAVVGVFTTVIIYFLSKKMFGSNVAVITGIIWSTYFSRRVWNPILIPLFSIIMLYLLIKVTKGHKKLIPFALLLFGLSLQIHFQAVAFLIPIAISIYYCFRKVKIFPLKATLLGILLLVATFTPLAVFDLRHNFINTITFLKFFGFINASAGNAQFNLFGGFISSLRVFLNYIWGLFPEFSFIKSIYLGPLVLLISTISVAYFKIPKSSKILILSFIIPPFFLFSLYKGGLSEYYFVLTWVTLIIGLAFFLTKIFESSILGKCTVIFIITSFVLFRFINLLHEVNFEGLYYQLQAASYIVNEKTDPIFNVSYSAPINTDAGFKYLFKYLGREPQNIAQGHLWTIVIPAGSENVKPLVTFGDIGVIRR